MYQSTFVRYERRGNRVIPVRVTKQWVTIEKPAFDGRKAPSVVSKFKTVRVTELRDFPAPAQWNMDAYAPYPRREYPDNSGARVETRERLFTLCDKDGEQVVREAGYDQRWLPYSLPANPTAAQAAWSLENGNGWVTGREDEL